MIAFIGKGWNIGKDLDSNLQDYYLLKQVVPVKAHYNSYTNKLFLYEFIY